MTDGETASDAPTDERTIQDPLDILSAVDPRPETDDDKAENGESQEPPAKKRRGNEGESIPRRKPESPPWKKAVAEGPSSFTQNGMRKSGRTNAIPLELQPPSDKRQTRGAIQSSTRRKNGSLHGKAPSRDIPSLHESKRPTSSSHISNKGSSKPTASPKRSHRNSMPSQQVSTPLRSHKKPACKDPQSAPAQPRATRLKRSSRLGESHNENDPVLSNGLQTELNGESPKTVAKIRFRVKPPTLPFINKGLVITRPKQYSTLAEFFEKAKHVHVDDGGLFHPDESPEYTPELVAEDARLLLQVEEAARPGGVLSPDICSVYQNIEPVPIPRQYARQDHTNAAAIVFRKLLLQEQRKHRANAKRLAEACRDEWNRRQPKSQEQLEAEEYKANITRYRTLVRTLQITWENIRLEVNRRRLLEWEAQEQIRVRKALNEAVDISTQKLQARRAHMDSEAPSDEEEEDDDEEDDKDSVETKADSDTDSEDQDSNMSESGSEADEDKLSDTAGDENLSKEQLEMKYAFLQAHELDFNQDVMDLDEDRTPEPEPASVIDSEEDDSDESIDMDDDMGSSDEVSESESDEEDDDDAGESGLLGFLPTSDVKALMDTSTKDFDDKMIGNDASMGEANTAASQNLDEPKDGPDSLTQVGTSIGENATLPNGTADLTGASPVAQVLPAVTEADSVQTDVESVVEVQASGLATKSSTPPLVSKLKTPVPFLLRGTLREYQHYGLDWLANLYANNTNGILADEMGLGKTIQTIALLAHLACEHEIWGPHLVIVPTSVILNWEMEFKKWCPGFKILTYYGTQDERKRKRQGWRTDDHWNVCITSYQIILQDQQVFKRRQWHYMILDEAHNIKNFQSQRWQTMLTFRTRARLLLTGTPLQNNLTELWSLLYFLMPSDGTEQGVGGFANLKEFQDWFKKPSEQILEHGRDTMDDESRAIIAKLHKVLRPYLLRRLKVDVEKQMPGKFEHVEWCRLSKRQRELYDGFLSRDDTRGTLASGNYLSIINCLMQLRKVCNHPDLFIERAIMTSFPMEKSAIADFEIKELLVRRRLLREDPMTKASLDFLNLVPAKHEVLSDALTARSATLSASRTLMDMRETQRIRAQSALTNLDTTTAKSNLVYLESASRWGRFEELQHAVYLNALRRQQKPIYGSKLVEFLTLGLDKRPLRPQPKRRNHLMTWLEGTSTVLASMVPSIASRSQSVNTLVQKFACVTPPVIARDLTPLALTPRGASTVRTAVDSTNVDPFHEARMRLTIQFPDKRLLQYDCGKLQTLARLLRKLEAGGHRALIFTQMTKVLDILEQFLNIHGHKYLRLDGSTKIEQRQILTDRFNNDTRILAFILSTRSGGLGINLTGADTVIFYDLDWNPAMDKQCQDRCHRIGQTRDVHIYRLVSEHTIEANILRKANQKQMLDDVVIQEGDFTTDYFNKMNVRDVLGDDSGLLDGDQFANAAMDRVLGGVDNNKDMQKVIYQAEDREDVVAARIAEREIVQTDAADFDEHVVTNDQTPAGLNTPQEGAPTPSTPALDEVMNGVECDDEEEQNAWGTAIKSTDDYMLSFMTEMLKDTPVELPKEKTKNKKGRDHRSHRVR